LAHLSLSKSNGIPIKNPSDLRNFGSAPRFSRKYQTLVERGRGAQGHTHVSLPIEAKKLKTTPKNLEQISLWKHFPGPKGFIRAHDEHSTTNHLLWIHGFLSLAGTKRMVTVR
jgi:hypothetical protein